MLHSLRESGTSNEDDELIMVARGGELIRVKVSIAERSSPYFFALLRNGMIESGKDLPLYLCDPALLHGLCFF
jgi:hypothetical protein